MILVVLFAILVVGVIFIILSNLNWKKYKNDDGKFKNKIFEFLYNYDSLTSVIGWVIAVISGILLLSFSITIVDVHTTAEADKFQLQETYKALEYKVTTDAARDEFGLLNKEIVDEVQKWNEDIAYKKAMQNNFWYGVLYADIYDDINTIELK